MQYEATDWMFRDLNAKEEIVFRQWARDHQTTEHYSKKMIYHPVIRDEWSCIGYKGE